MLRQNGHLPGTAGDTACDQRGANSLIITPPPPTHTVCWIANGKGGRAGGGAALFCPYYETNTNCTNEHEYIRLISEIRVQKKSTKFTNSINQFTL